LAERYHWTPEQIAQLDPDYATELRAWLLAESHHCREKTKPKDD
jgi:hypothetical protein